MADLARSALLDTEIPDDEAGQIAKARNIELEDYRSHIKGRSDIARQMEQELRSSSGSVSETGLNQLGGSLQSMFPGAVIDG
ncbi:hypothetical protein [Mycobacterium sp. URHB0021]